MTSTPKNSATNERRLPDDKLCQTRILGAFGTVAVCLTEQPENCPHVSKYGKADICLRGLTMKGLPPDSEKSGSADKSWRK